MADRKITDLTALAAGSQATGDLLTIVDVSEAAAADKNKKITVESLFKGIPSNVGIGTSSPSQKLHINDSSAAFTQYESGSFDGYVGQRSSGILEIAQAQAGNITFLTNGSERLRIDSSGRLLVGTTADKSISSDANALVQIFTSSAGKLLIGRSDASVVANDVLGIIDFHTFDGGSQRGARIAAVADGDHASGDVPSRIEFSTCADGSSTLTERMRIDSSGNVGVGITPTAKFHVGGTIQSQTGSTVAQMFTDGGAAYFTSVGAYPMLFQTNGSERMRIDSSGNVIIGTTAAADSAKLTVRDVAPKLSLYATPGNTSRLLLGDTDDADIGQVLYDNSDNSMGFVTNAATRVLINSSGNVGIGTTSPSGKLNIEGSDSQLLNLVQTSGDLAIRLNDSGVGSAYIKVRDNTGGSLSFDTGGSERMRIDSSGRLLVGNTSSAGNSTLQVQGLTGLDARGAIQLQYNGSPSGSTTMSEVRFTDSSGNQGAVIGARSASTWASNDYPGELTFSTTADGASSPTERMRIASSGYVEIGNTQDTNSYLLVNTISNQNAVFNRTGTDGTLVIFRHAGTTEGTISVSGNTVSYNGGHLSRWSQLAGGAERTEILRGSVLSNLDEMCEWAYDAQDAVLYTEEDELPEGVSVGDVKTPAQDAGTEDNEQLNRMKVSDVEGDPNVSGVFQSWDDDDDTYTNDFYCAMTGDFVIRIAQGTTVARGDLLMSAGDGTAKPQDDDIVRSKTIAKVTSTTVSTTYSDGSYCVPCVLMAC